eukprot:8404824-Alexandrium_andersonii.AAC.1
MISLRPSLSRLLSFRKRSRAVAELIACLPGLRWKRASMCCLADVSLRERLCEVELRVHGPWGCKLGRVMPVQSWSCERVLQT